ncbi:hypothetical protein SCB49_02429 [unidentified eubacterium SCB49]|nr:hypothetical protein SCB49_02429 [unidentified eubacterium SCB49]
MPNPRYLTKSRFKLALDCPTKLFYTRKSDYEDASETDSFLQGLAQGGFQVEELARLYFTEGVAILGDDYNYDKLVARTNVLLEQENVTIFEPAFLVDGLFIRVDILEKKGNKIRLIEVKAKSIDSESHDSFITGKGTLGGGMGAYLYDVAFQQYVIQQCHPDWNIKAYLNLVDKSKKTSVNGLNSHFKIVPNSELRTNVAVTPGLSKSDVGVSIMAMIDVQEEVALILNTNPIQSEKTFSDTVNYYRDHYANDIKIESPIGAQCGGCEFKLDNPPPGKKSGFHECWMKQLPILKPELGKVTTAIIDQPKAWDIWFKPAKNAISENRFFTSELTRNDVKDDPGAYGMSRSDRQWLQIEKTNTQDNTVEVDIENLRLEMKSWVYPLNFIDFETCAVAIPFTAGMRPYEQLAFQYSHHIVYENGRVEHHSDYINLEIGKFPNFEFIRALKKSLDHNEGSIFRYHNHENTIVNVIYNQLQVSSEIDKVELMAFIKTISHNTGSSAGTWSGNRDMIDLQKTVVNYYFHPQTGGSNSIKAILPAVLESSEFLKQKYTQPIKDINLTTLNFEEDHCFLQLDNGVAVNPYKSLPPLFDGVSNEDLEEAIEHATKEDRQIADGGAALFAYAKLQDATISEVERAETRAALLRYCELDTLAMVMIFECFKELIE